MGAVRSITTWVNGQQQNDDYYMKRDTSIDNLKKKS